MMYYIYKATNKINGKVYIGQTVDFKRRKKEHLSSKNGKHSKSIFHRAINKYGKENFEWEILETCETLDEALHFESFYILKYRSCTFYEDCNGYNIIFKDDKNVISHNARKVIAYDLNGKFIKIFNSAEEAGRELNCIGSLIDKVIKGKRKSTGGYIFKEYLKDYKLQIEPYKTQELERKYKKVFQYDEYGKLLNTFHSVSECADEIGINRNTLSRKIKNQEHYKNLYYRFN